MLTNESTSAMLRLQFHSKLRTRFFKFVNVSKVSVESFSMLNKLDQQTFHQNFVNKKRSENFHKKCLSNSVFKIENLEFDKELKWNPYFFEEIFKKKVILSDKGINISDLNIIKQYHYQSKDLLKNLYITKLLRKRKSHLVILCHGYQGKKTDMRILENYFIKIFPHTIFLISEFNQCMDKIMIEDMGRNLAKEVETFVSKFTNYSKISFVGHSLGGIIIRSALPYLKKFRPYMCTYVSLSVPHLGCRTSKNILINLGMKFLVSVKKDIVIRQLRLEDHSDIRKTFLYRLSSEDCLHWFQNILLVSSPQDSFVPYFSSRIQPLDQPDELYDQILKEMSEMIWSKVSNEEIIRFDVDIHSPEK